jgi:choline-sulfatase
MTPTLPTVANMLRATGYECSYFGKWHLGGDVTDYGFEHGEESTHDESTRQMAARRWRDRDWVMNERPFFDMVSFINPHDHYFFDPAERVEGFKRPWQNCSRDPASVPKAAGGKMVTWPEAKWGAYHEYYSEQIRRLEIDLGELLHQFRTGGFYNSSWIIFTTDHGDMAGEHNLPFKGSYMYEGVVRVPLIIVPPMTRFLGQDRGNRFGHDIKPGRRDALCSLIDLLPTICELGQTPIPANLPGKSLLPWIRGERSDDVHNTVFAEWHQPAIRMARSRTHKLVNYGVSGSELYDLQADPHETNNRAGDPHLAQVQADLTQRLEQHIQTTNDPFHDLSRHEFIFNPKGNLQMGPW